MQPSMDALLASSSLFSHGYRFPSCGRMRNSPAHPLLQPAATLLLSPLPSPSGLAGAAF